MVIRRFARTVGVITAWMVPPRTPFPPPHELLADLEADFEVWGEQQNRRAANPPSLRGARLAAANPGQPAGGGEPPITDPPLAEWERELRDEFKQAQFGETVAAVTRAILRAHDIVGAPIYADLIAQAITDRYLLTPRQQNGENL